VSENKTAPARWEDRDGNALQFDPREWTEVEG